MNIKSTQLKAIQFLAELQTLKHTCISHFPSMNSHRQQPLILEHQVTRLRFQKVISQSKKAKRLEDKRGCWVWGRKHPNVPNAACQTRKLGWSRYPGFCEEET